MGLRSGGIGGGGGRACCDDEAEEFSLVVFDVALGQTMARGEVPAQTVISSTHRYADGTMTEVLRRAKDRG